MSGGMGGWRGRGREDNFLKIYLFGRVLEGEKKNPKPTPC